MKDFHPNINMYKIVINPELKDFLDTEYMIILPKEREDNFIFIDMSQRLPD